MSETNKKVQISLILLYSAYIMSAFFKISANIVMPVYQQQLGISSSMTGFIASMYYVSYSFLQIFTGPLCNKFGSLKVVGIGFLFSTAGALCFAFTSSALIIALGRFFVGIGAGTVFISIVAFLTFNYSGRKYAILSGLAVTCSGFGQLIGSAPLKALISSFGIPAVFICLAVFMFVISILMLVFSKDINSGTSSKTGILKQIAEGARYSLKNPVILAGAFLWTMYNSFQHSYQGLWSATYSVLAFEKYSDYSGLSASMVSIGLMAGTAVSEFLRLKDSTRRKSVITSEILFAVSAVAVPLSHNISFICMLLCDFVLGFCIGHICIQMTAYTKTAAGNEKNAIVMGFMNFISSLGTVLFQSLTGLSVDLLGERTNKSFTTTFALYASLTVLTVLITVILQNNHKEIGRELA